jgi:hypothetical protein
VITHTRIRVKNGKVEEAPKGFKYWRYPRLTGWTDIRFMVIDPAKYDIEFEYDLAKTVSQIAKVNKAIAAFNFPFSIKVESSDLLMMTKMYGRYTRQKPSIGQSFT